MGRQRKMLLCVLALLALPGIQAYFTNHTEEEREREDVCEVCQEVY